MRDHMFFIRPTVSGEDPVTLHAKVKDLEEEVVTLREQLGKAKGINDLMWDTVVQRVVREEKQPGADEDDGRTRKRGRTDI
jgi:pre-rRNA-processing protein IPI3